MCMKTIKTSEKVSYAGNERISFGQRSTFEYNYKNHPYRRIHIPNTYHRIKIMFTYRKLSFRFAGCNVTTRAASRANPWCRARPWSRLVSTARHWKKPCFMASLYNKNGSAYLTHHGSLPLHGWGQHGSFHGAGGVNASCSTTVF